MRKKKHSNNDHKGTELDLPPYSAFQKASARHQVLMWQNAKKWLTSERRAEANLKGQKKPNFAKTADFIQKMEAHWAQLRKTAQTHPDYFDWPETIIWLGDGKLDPTQWLDEGILSIFGYTVGQEENLSASQREHRLDDIFSLEIPPVLPLVHLQIWGSPKSSMRLQKMANCIASFARNAKHRKQKRMRTAIAKWEADLSYLEREYYMGKFGFGFPRSAV